MKLENPGYSKFALNRFKQRRQSLRLRPEHFSDAAQFEKITYETGREDNEKEN